MLSAMPCNLLCSFLAKVQNDKVLLSLQVDFLLWLCLASHSVATLKTTKADFCFKLRFARCLVAR